MEWRSQSWMFNDPCRVCGVRRLDHDPARSKHPFKSPVLADSALPVEADHWEKVVAGSANRVERSVFRHTERELNGEYRAPLPSPADRREIRERAGLTQEEMAERLMVSRTTVVRWEKPAGYGGGRRLPGREPIGELRVMYSNLLRSLAEHSA